MNHQPGIGIGIGMNVQSGIGIDMVVSVEHYRPSYLRNWLSYSNFKFDKKNSKDFQIIALVDKNIDNTANF